jgi:hypothetical protein
VAEQRKNKNEKATCRTISAMAVYNMCIRVTPYFSKGTPTAGPSTSSVPLVDVCGLEFFRPEVDVVGINVVEVVDGSVGGDNSSS